MRLDQSNILCRSVWGTPRMSAMTCSGSSAATSVTKSNSPRGVTLSRIGAGPRGSVCSSWVIIRGVKPLFTSRRYRVCIGGSMFSIMSRCWSRSAGAMSHMNAAPRADEKVWLSRLTVTTSS